MTVIRQHATRLGTFARDIVAGGGEADVIAVFERSFYLLCQKGIVAVCLEGLGNGPINILVPTGGSSWRGVVREGQKAEVSASSISIHAALTIPLDGATIWQPSLWPIYAAARCTDGIADLRRLAAASLPHDGLSPLIFAADTSAARTPTALAAREQVATLIRALPDAIATQSWPTAALSAAALLIGLGPGLTPSGDDLLGGLLLALSARGETTLRDALWDALVDELNDLTVPVSAMHLTAAAHGLGHEALHDFINAVMTNDTAHLCMRLAAVARIGATSGFDAVAGVVLGLNA